MVFVVFGCRKHRFTLSSGCVLSPCLWFLTLTLYCQMATEIIIKGKEREEKTRQVRKDKTRRGSKERKRKKNVILADPRS